MSSKADVAPGSVVGNGVEELHAGTDLAVLVIGLQHGAVKIVCALSRAERCERVEIRSAVPVDVLLFNRRVLCVL